MSRGNDRRGMGRGRRLLVLGATHYQIPFIEYARAQGCHVITVDWDQRNPAHAHADESHEVSTTDPDAVLALARRIGIDAITTFGSDPAVPTVARVAAALGLPGADVDAVETLSRKDRFRAAQRAAGLPTPEFAVFGEGAGAGAASAALPAHPRIVYKPVDNCGSKGVTVVEGDAEGDAGAPAAALGPAPRHAAARRRALEHSRAGLGIVEQYIDGVHLHGDGWLQEGRLVHHYLGHEFLSDVDGTCVPISDWWPSGQPAAVEAEVARQVEQVAQRVGYVTGPVNIEARVDGGGRVVLIELAPRNSGGFTTDIHHRLTGLDFRACVLALACGRDPKAVFRDSAPLTRGIGCDMVVFLRRPGNLVAVDFKPLVQPFMHLWQPLVQPGQRIQPLAQSNHIIGELLLVFPSLEIQQQIRHTVSEWLHVQIA